jgi:pyrroloquinoline quinone (PQQ) biosynthesis protein C
MEVLLAIRKRVYEELCATRIVRGVLDGKPDLAAYRGYLANARWYAQYSPVVMALGASRCSASHPELAAYLLHHAAEEQGHDGWALADLADLGVPQAEALAMRPVPSCAALVGYVHYLAGHANPVALFGWMYVLEAVGNDLGTIVGKQLAQGIGGGGGGKGPVRFVAGHGIADTDHTAELAEQISAHVRAPEDQAAVAEAATVVADLYLRMFREIGGEQARWASA